MPTQGDVFSTIISEVTGKPISEVSEMLDAFRLANPGVDKFDEEITQEEFDSCVADLRTEKAGILNWLIQSGLHRPS